MLTFEHSPACTRDTSPRTSRLTKEMTNTTDVIARFIILFLLRCLESIAKPSPLPSPFPGRRRLPSPPGGEGQGEELSVAYPIRGVLTFKGHHLLSSYPVHGDRLLVTVQMVKSGEQGEGDPGLHFAPSRLRSYATA